MIKYLICAFLLCQYTLNGMGERERFFTDIYDNRGWGANEEGVGYSGMGSTLQHATPYVQILEFFIKTHNIDTIVDVGCGDWTLSRHIDFGNAHYSGYDTVAGLIQKNKEKFSSDKITFHHADVIDFDLPKADLLICKDVLQHLSNEDVVIFLKQLPKFKYCLITNDVDSRTLTSQNSQISGDYRNIDLTAPPFNIKGVKALTFRSGYVTKQVLYINRTNND